jgi:hypothetical protein
LVALRENAKLALVDTSRKALIAQARVLAMGTAAHTQTMVNDFVVLGDRLILLLMNKCYPPLHLFCLVLALKNHPVITPLIQKRIVSHTSPRILEEEMKMD